MQNAVSLTYLTLELDTFFCSTTSFASDLLSVSDTGTSEQPLSPLLTKELLQTDEFSGVELKLEFCPLLMAVFLNENECSFSDVISETLHCPEVINVPDFS